MKEDTMNENMKTSAYTFEKLLEKDGRLVYKTKGVSMLPLIRQGKDLIILKKKEPSVRCKRLDTVMFRRDNGQYVLHRILKVNPDGYWIVGDNCTSGENVREDQVLGVMTTLHRNQRDIKVTDLDYRIYSHIWNDCWPLRFRVFRTFRRANAICVRLKKCLHSADGRTKESSDRLQNRISLTQEQELFIDIIKDFLHDKSSDYSNPIDWNVIKGYADNHQITAIFYKQTKQMIFQNAYAAQIYRYANFRNAIESFKKALRGYQYILVKGAEVAALYPVPALRSMSDADALIHADDREAIHQALLSAGFQFQDEAEGEWKYIKNGYLFEVHDSLVHRREDLNDLVDYFSGVWDYVDHNQLDWSYHLIFLIEHLRHHFVSHGVGFRQFMDVAVVCQKCNLDWKFIETELKKIKLYDFAMTVFAFNKRWFDIDVPVKTTELTDEFYILSTQKIFENGVFGFDNEDNQAASVASKMHYQGVGQGEAKRKYLISKLFPHYETMCRLPYCRYIKKSKLLLPIAWFHRIIYRTFSKSSRENLKQQLASDKVTERMDLLHQWGL